MGDRFMKKLLAVLACVLFLGSFSDRADAGLVEYDYSGNLTYHNDVLQFRFSVTESSLVTLFSSSWHRGGFDPIMALWDAAGNLLMEQDDGHNVGTTMSNGVEYRHGNWDSYFSQIVDAGSYIVTIATYNNWALGSLLSDGFTFDSDNPALIADWYQPSNGNKESFFEFHILGANQASGPSPTPEPGTIVLMALGLGGMYLIIRRRRLQES